MTCDSCKATIYQNLMELHEVESVEIDREKGEAIISMTSKIEISTLQNTLPSKFNISEKVFDNLNLFLPIFLLLKKMFLLFL